MNLYLFLSVIIICITFIICFTLIHFTDITNYYEYKSEYYTRLNENRDIQKIKEEYNLSIKKITDKINKLSCFNSMILENCKTNQLKLHDIASIVSSKDLKDNNKLIEIVNILHKIYYDKERID